MQTYLVLVSLLSVVSTIYCQPQPVQLPPPGSVNYRDYFSSRANNIEYSTPSPANIQSEKAIPVDVPPLHLVIDAAGPLVLSNNGKILQAVISAPASRSYVTGGVLGSNIYQFYKIVYVWNNDYTAPPTSNIDGISDPIQFSFYFFKREYGTFKEASENHRDGVFILTGGIEVQGNIPNSNFTQFESLLHQVVLPNSAVAATGPAVIGWLDRYSEIQTYYIMYGCVRNYQTEQVYYTSIDAIIGSGYSVYISIAQFNAFRSLLSSGYSPLIPPVGSFPQGDRVVLQAQKVTGQMINVHP